MDEAIKDREKEKSEIDRGVLDNVMQQNKVLFDSLQKSMLIGFFTNRDAFMIQLLTQLSVYYDQVFKCEEMMKQLKEVHNSNNPNPELRISKKINLLKTMQDTFDQAQKLINFLMNLEQTGQNEEINRNDYKQYKNASQAEKAKILVDSNELRKLEDGLSNNKVLAKTKGYLPDPKLFQSIHKRIYEILKMNYLPEFY